MAIFTDFFLVTLIGHLGTKPKKKHQINELPRNSQTLVSTNQKLKYLPLKFFRKSIKKITENFEVKLWP
jgi:hypothetical protein